MLRLPPLSFLRPGSVGEALAILAGEGPAARLVAGGTDLLPNLKRRHQQATTLVSLMRVAELAGVADANSGGLRIGATTTLSAVAGDAAVRARYPALARAVEAISSPPLRNMGTLGGNLCLDTRCTYYNQSEEWRRSIDYCMKEAGTVCWVATSSPRCWAHSASDAAPMLCALDATVLLASRGSEREIPLAALYREDGIDYLTKRPDEALVEVGVPAASDAAHCRSAFWKLRRRGAIDFAVLSAATAVWLDAGNAVTRAEIWLGAVGSAPRRAEAAARSLVGQQLDAGTIAAAAELAKKAATPMDNTDFQTQWRKAVVGRYVEAALAECVGLPVGRLSRQ